MKLIVLCLVAVAALDLRDSNRNFTSVLYKEFTTTNIGGFVICPLSLQILLTLVHAGAKNETATQLADALALPNDEDELLDTYKSIIQKTESSSNSFRSNVVNKIYVYEGFGINSTFKTIATKTFKADIESVNFKEKDSAVLQINEWVRNKTKSKIREFVTVNDLPHDTQAMLINTLYMEGIWENLFTAVNRQKFYTDDVNYIQLEMMEQKKVFTYHESSELNAKILKMKYRQSQFSLTIILPNDRTGLKNLEANISAVLKEPNYTNAKVDLKLPKFKMTTGVQLIPILQQMGVRELFTSNADLSNMGLPKIYISEIIQKNYIDVNENGTTATSASRVSARLGRPKSLQEKEFIADHPFIFYIRSSVGIVFVGRFTGN